MNLKPKKGFVMAQLNIERLTPLQWDGIMRAMDAYAEHYHQCQLDKMNRKSIAPRPVAKMKVKWRDYDCIIQKLRYRDKVAKLIPDYAGKIMPFEYFWVDFSEIGFDE